MKKIRTLFERDEKTKKVIPVIASGVAAHGLAYPFEKLDGTNVRLTIRSGEVVRIEKRRNPTKIQKAKGLIEPWYVDADPHDPNDKYVYDAVVCPALKAADDGEYTAELIGPKINGNYYELESRVIVQHPSMTAMSGGIFRFGPFSAEFMHINCPKGAYDRIRDKLSNYYSSVTASKLIEGLVFYQEGRAIAKIKRKDFPG